MHIAESQSQSIQKMSDDIQKVTDDLQKVSDDLKIVSETVRLQSIVAAEHTIQIIERGRQIDMQIDAIMGLAKQGDHHDDRIADLERWRDQQNPQN